MKNLHNWQPDDTDPKFNRVICGECELIRHHSARYTTPEGATIKHTTSCINKTTGKSAYNPKSQIKGDIGYRTNGGKIVARGFINSQSSYHGGYTE